MISVCIKYFQLYKFWLNLCFDPLGHKEFCKIHFSNLYSFNSSRISQLKLLSIAVTIWLFYENLYLCNYAHADVSNMTFEDKGQ